MASARLVPLLLLTAASGGATLSAQTQASGHNQLAARIIEEGTERSEIMSFQDELCHDIGSRLTGSRAFDRAADWAVAHFRAMGLEAKLDKWGEWKIGWDRGQWMGRMVEPTQLELQVACPAWTGSTNGIQRGRLVPMPTNVKEFRTFRRKIDPDESYWLYGAIPRDGEVRDMVMSLLNGDDSAANVVGLVQSATSTRRNDKRFENQIRVFGDRNAGLKPYEDRQQWPHAVVRDDQAKLLEEAIKKSARKGDAPVVEFELRNRWRRGPVVLNNVVADLVGTEFPDEYVIICAHLDSWHQATGATDNGTGTCSTIEAARILTKLGVRPKRTIRFILWGGEEQGLLGSRQYVVQNRTRMHKVSAVFNHDSGTNWAHQLRVAESHAAEFEQIIAPIVKSMKPADPQHDGPAFALNPVEVMKPAGGGSDHASFAAVGVPAFSWRLTGHVPYARGWHSQWDTYSIVVPHFQKHNATVFAVIAAGVANLDQMLSREGVERATPGGRRSRVNAKLIVETWLGLELDGTSVTSVTADSIAARARLQAGDRIVAVGKEPVENARELLAEFRKLAGEREVVPVFVERDGKRVEIGVRP